MVADFAWAELTERRKQQRGVAARISGIERVVESAEGALGKQCRRRIQRTRANAVEDLLVHTRVRARSDAEQWPAQRVVMGPRALGRARRVCGLPRVIV